MAICAGRSYGCGYRNNELQDAFFASIFDSKCKELIIFYCDADFENSNYYLK
jgi:hypothetical protein